MKSIPIIIVGFTIFNLVITAQPLRQIQKFDRDTTFIPNGNPIIKYKYTADPAAMVYDGKVYLYTGQDVAPVRDSRSFFIW